MTPSLSIRQNTATNSSNTLIHRTHTLSSLQRTPVRIVPYPSWDTLVSQGTDNTLITTMYRKLTHTDQCLHLESNHSISAKNSIFNTLAQMARVVCTNKPTLQQEDDHIRKALLACKSPQDPQQSTKNSEKFKKACNSLGIQAHLKGNNYIWTLLMAPRDKDNMSEK